MEQSKWQLILHEQHEDPYFEITNGPISLCCNAGFVGETEDEEDAIFKKVTDALNSSGIDFHSENPLELKQHIEIQELQAKCERYETALNAIIGRNMPVPNKVDMIKIVREALGLDERGSIANEALSGEGGNGADLFKFTEWAHENAVVQYENGKFHSWRLFGPNADDKDYTTAQLWDRYQKEDKQ